MADRDHTHTTTTTGTTGPTTPTHTTTAGDRAYARDPHATTTTNTTKRRGTSWIGAIIALLAILVLAAWLVGGFGDGEETAMMVGDPVAEEPMVATEPERDAVIVAPVEGTEPAAPMAEPAVPAQPVQ